MTALNAKFIEQMPVKDSERRDWVDSITRLSGDMAAVGRFCSDTGITCESAPLDDEALGLAFARWFNDTIWGVER